MRTLLVRLAVMAAGLILGVSAAVAGSSDTYFKTPSGGFAPGAVQMCADGSGNAVVCSDPTATPASVAGAYPYNVEGSTITRAADTTAYSAGRTVCAAKTVTACVPGTIGLATANGGKVTISRVTLLKSGSSTTSANFTIWFFSAAPILATPTQFDATAYSGPRSADMPNYIGSASCAAPAATSDTSPGVWYECTLSNPNTAGALVAKALTGSVNINYLISVNAAYTPASAETFTPYVSGFY